MIFYFNKKVYGYECDIYGHMNNANYLTMLEAARSEALQEMGMPINEFLARGIQLFVLRYELDFVRAINLEETVQIKSWCYKMNRLKGFWRQEVYNEKDELCFVALLTVVHASEGKAKRLPVDVFEHISQYVQEQEG